MTPFRSEKNTNWEGAFRVPAIVRWPGKIPAGAVSNEIVSHLDWLPTFLAAAGDPDVKEKLLEGHEAGDKTFRVHLDGYDLLPYLTGEVDEEPAPGLLLLLRRRRPRRAALRQLEDRVHGAAGAPGRCRSGPSRSSRCAFRSSSTSAPTRSSGPTSRPTPTGTGCIDRAFMLYPMADIVGEFLSTFMEFPPRMKAASFTIDQVQARIEAAISAGH